MSDRLNLSEEIDWISVGLYFLLVVFGWMNIFASSYNDQFRSIFDIRQSYGDQLLWIFISTLMIILLFAIDHRFFHFSAYAIFAFSVLLLLAVLAFGVQVNASRSWIRIMGFNLQPSEFVKMAVALVIARYLSGYNVKLWTLESIAIMGLLIGLPVALIIIQPDWGTALVFSCFIIVMYREGMPGWILASTLFFTMLFLMTLMLKNTTVVITLTSIAIIGFALINKKAIHAVVAAAIVTLTYFGLRSLLPAMHYTLSVYQVLLVSVVVSSVIFLVLGILRKLKNVALVLTFLFIFIGFTFTVDYVFHNILKPHQQTRMNILLGKETDIRDVGYNLNQSKIAIGSGGLLGKGYLKGTQTKLDFVPEQSTDFIFCTVGEEWGFIGTAIVLLLYTGLLIRILYLAERQRSQFARIYGYGVASILFFHFAINISMTIGLFPVIGIPLPFFSYGGSSMLAFTLLLFILIRLDSVRKIYIK
jgi:rod shape determining protein RodA